MTSRTGAERFGAGMGQVVTCWATCNVVLKCEGVVEMTWLQAFAPLLWLMVICLALLGLCKLVEK